MTPGQRTLTDRVATALEADPRVIAAWLMGSLGRGGGDRFSDVDVWAVVAAGDVEAFAADWPALWGAVQPSVLTLRTGRGGGVTISQVGEDCSRLDVTVTSPVAVPSRARDSVSPLFDRGGLTRRLGPPATSRPPAPERVAALAQEFLRVLGLLPVVIGRGELVVAASGAGLLRTMLIDLVREEAALPHPPGALRLRAVISPERARMLASLPPVEATRDSAVALHLACARQFLPIARRLAAETGAGWPSGLERAVAGHLRRELGVELEE